MELRQPPVSSRLQADQQTGHGQSASRASTNISTSLTCRRDNDATIAAIRPRFRPTSRHSPAIHVCRPLVEMTEPEAKPSSPGGTAASASARGTSSSSQNIHAAQTYAPQPMHLSPAPPELLQPTDLDPSSLAAAHHRHLSEESRSQVPFAPVFTLVTNATTRATHHPQVHYVFSDDDPALLTEALARAHAHAGPSPDPTTTTTTTTNTSSSLTASARPPPPDRALVLDLAPPPGPGGEWTVRAASSLARDWAVVSTRVSRMAADESATPAEGGSGGGGGGGGGPRSREAEADGDGHRDDEDDDDSDEKDGGGAEGRLMLRIEGLEAALVGGDDATAAAAAAAATAALNQSGGSGPARLPEEEYAELTEEFARRMGLLRKVVAAGEAGAKVIEQHGGEEAGR